MYHLELILGGTRGWPLPALEDFSLCKLCGRTPSGYRPPSRSRSDWTSDPVDFLEFWSGFPSFPNPLSFSSFWREGISEPCLFSRFWSGPRPLSIFWISFAIWLRRSFRKLSRVVNLVNAEVVEFTPYGAHSRGKQHEYISYNIYSCEITCFKPAWPREICTHFHRINRNQRAFYSTRFESPSFLNILPILPNQSNNLIWHRVPYFPSTTRKFNSLPHSLYWTSWNWLKKRVWSCHYVLNPAAGFQSHPYTYPAIRDLP